MITSLDVGGLAYTPIVSDKVTGSLFREISAGVNLPREVTIRHAEYVDSKTKRPGRRSVLRLDRHIEMSDGTIAPVSFMLIAMLPTDTAVTSSVITDVMEIARCVHSGHVGSTDIGSAVFATASQ